MSKLTTEEIRLRAIMEATFYPNFVKESGFRYKATHLDGRRAPKVVLCNDPRIRPGIPCQVRIKAIRKPERDDRGAIEVEFVSIQQFRIEGVYLDPIVGKKLQVLLESGLNILLVQCGGQSRRRIHRHIRRRRRPARPLCPAASRLHAAR
jgi:nitric oxide reductase NorQ protein